MARPATAEALPPGTDAFTRREWSLIKGLRTPELVQRWLRSLPYNYEENGETVRTFRIVARLGTAHCLEAALCSVMIMQQPGSPPLPLAMESVAELDPVVFVDGLHVEE